jgi:hypothetical protein
MSASVGNDRWVAAVAHQNSSLLAVRRSQFTVDEGM